MDSLSREEEATLRLIGRRSLEKAAKAGSDKSAPGISRRTMKVVADNGDGTLDLNSGSDEDPEIQPGIRMLSGCAGAKVDDIVVVETIDHVSYATGVVLHGNSHYVKKLWTGSWKGGSITVPGISRYTVLIVTAGSMNALGVKSFLVTKRIGWDSDEITYMGTNTQMEGDKTIHIEAFSATSTVGEPDVLRAFGTNNTPFRSYGVGPSGDSNGVGFAASEPVIGIYGLL